MPQMKSNLLKAERIRRGWTQITVAEAVGVDAKTVGRWERGTTVPYPYFREQLCFLFEKTPEQLGLLSDDESNLLEDATSFGIRSTAVMGYSGLGWDQSPMCWGIWLAGACS